jgi:hypothetical protein
MAQESSDSSWPLRHDAGVRRRWDFAGQGLGEYVDAVYQRASVRPERRILMSTRRVFLAVGVAVLALVLAAVALGANLRHGVRPEADRHHHPSDRDQ